MSVPPRRSPRGRRRSPRRVAWRRKRRMRSGAAARDRIRRPACLGPAEAPAAAPASDAAGAPPLSFSKSSAAKQPRSAAAAGDRSAPCKKWPTVTPASGQQQARPGSSGRVLARYDTVTKTLHGVARGDIVRGADPHVPIYQGITPREEEEVSNSHRPEPNSPPSPPLEGAAAAVIGS